jgi:hypothetical protein
MQNERFEAEVKFYLENNSSELKREHIVGKEKINTQH